MTELKIFNSPLKQVISLRFFFGTIGEIAQILFLRIPFTFTKINSTCAEPVNNGLKYKNFYQ